MTAEVTLEKLARVDARGQRIYSPEQIRHVLPLVVMATKTPLEGRPLLARELTAFQQRAGLSASMSDAEMSRAINRYYMRHPPLPALMVELRRGLLELVMVKGEARAKACTQKRAAPATTCHALQAPGKW